MIEIVVITIQTYNFCRFAYLQSYFLSFLKLNGMKCSRSQCLLVLLVTYFELLKNAASGSLPLNAPCSSELQNECGLNAYCDAQYSRCWCKFGTTPNSTTDCEVMRCFHDFECRQHFGFLAQCPITAAYKRYCGCDSSYPNVYFNAIQQKCIFADDPSDKTACDHDYQCGDGMICHRVNMIKRECRCKFGYKRQHMQQCVPIECRADFECQATNSKCNSNGKCVYADNFELENNNVCVRVNVELKEQVKPKEKTEQKDEETKVTLSTIVYISSIIGLMLISCGMAVCHSSNKTTSTPNAIGLLHRIDVRPTEEFVLLNQNKPLMDDDSPPTYDEVMRNYK